MRCADDRLLVCVAGGCCLRGDGWVPRWCVWQVAGVCEVLCGCHSVGVCGGWLVCANWCVDVVVCVSMRRGIAGPTCHGVVL